MLLGRSLVVMSSARWSRHEKKPGSNLSSGLAMENGRRVVKVVKVILVKIKNKQKRPRNGLFAIIRPVNLVSNVSDSSNPHAHHGEVVVGFCTVAVVVDFGLEGIDDLSGGVEVASAQDID